VRRERSDGELIAASVDDADAFGEFYDRYVGRVLAFFRRRVHDPELALDLAAETFASALASRSGFTGEEQPAVAWLFAIAHARWVDAVRRGRVEDRARRTLGMEPIIVDDEALAVIDRVAATGALELLKLLSDEQRDAVLARHIEDRGYGEIACELGTSESVIRKRVSRGLRTLRSAGSRWSDHD
jgi:RNA polymerase sigma-70 factor (ECF subfamily)